MSKSPKKRKDECDYEYLQESEMEEPKTKRSRESEFEVCGVSRSGRIRKKSSKLFDLNSSEENNQEKVKKKGVLINDSPKKSKSSPTKTKPATEASVRSKKPLIKFKNPDSFSMLSEDFYEINEGNTLSKSSDAADEMDFKRDAKSQKYRNEVERTLSGESEKKALSYTTTKSGKKAKIISTGKFSKNLSSKKHRKISQSEENSSEDNAKSTGTQPVDVAAYLALIGECLTNIGSKLKEHAVGERALSRPYGFPFQGTVAVSGSLSVLLDSLVCSLAPLLTLTLKVPDMNVIKDDVLLKCFDNIAYIIPGL